jgi:alkylation response protein AidB-like acyl-CoA dehydrogenase
VTRATGAAHPARGAIAAKVVVPAITLPGQRYDSVAGPAFDPNAMTLSGAVSFVAFAPSADLFLVSAKAGSEAILCLVPRDAAGLAVATTPNVDGSTSSTLTFSRVAVGDGGIVAKGGLAAATAARMQELIVLGTSAELLGVAEAALDLTVQYTRLREQFGRKIGSFQALQHRMVDCYVDAELNRSLLFKVLSAWDAGTCHPAMVSAVKARVGKGALKTVRTALQLHGAIGYTDEHDVGVYYKRAVALAAKYGNEITHAGRFSTLTLTQRAAE